MEVTMTIASATLFDALARDAGNWSGTPMIGAGANVQTDLATRGNLTQLKRLGLITTFEDRGDTFVQFTATGAQLAFERGYMV